MVVENCTVEGSRFEYEAPYRCGLGEKQTEVQVIERNREGETLWSYVVRPTGIMCERSKF